MDSFYKQNGYLEYDAVARLGVSSPMNFVKRQLANENCTYLSKCCVDQRIISQVNIQIKNKINRNNSINILGGIIVRRMYCNW